MAFFKIREKIDSNYQVVYFSSGRIVAIDNMNGESKNGQSIEFYTNGKLKDVVNFKNGNAEGNSYLFHENGGLLNHRYWRKDKTIGYSLNFIPDSIGTLQNVVFYNDSGKATWWKKFDNKPFGLSILRTKVNTDSSK